MNIQQEDVKCLFEYHKDGYLINKKRRANCVVVGVRAGHLDSNGYRYIKVSRKLHLEHRLIFLWHHGYLPEFIDHINGISNDNRIENLREATISQNQFNKGIGKANTSGFKGISKNHNRWMAQVTVNGKRKYVGNYGTKEDAAHAYDIAAKKIYGDYARTNEMEGVFACR
jgi:hypothetical protein